MLKENIALDASVTAEQVNKIRKKYKIIHHLGKGISLNEGLGKKKDGVNKGGKGGT